MEGVVARRVEELPGMTISVIGAGAWARRWPRWSRRGLTRGRGRRVQEVVESYRTDHEDRPFLAGFRLADELTVTTALDEPLEGVDIVLLVAPSQFAPATVTAAEPLVIRHAAIVMVARGIELGTGRRVSQMPAEVLVDHDPSAIGVLDGPTLAREIMEGPPAATCIAVPDMVGAAEFPFVLMGDTLRVYTSDDVVGCDVGAAAKNLIAIAPGVADGLGCGMNTKAALITRAVAELTRLRVAVGGRPFMFLVLAGNGDLIPHVQEPVQQERPRRRRVGQGSVGRRHRQRAAEGGRRRCDGRGARGGGSNCCHRHAHLEHGRCRAPREISPVDVVPMLMKRSPCPSSIGSAVDPWREDARARGDVPGH
jgi:glycerol-3-phosphate dehydrogenase (NAD(P)+)